MGRVLTSIAPHEPEAYGLLALMELNAWRARRRAPPRGRADPPYWTRTARSGTNSRSDGGWGRLGERANSAEAGGAYALQAAIIAACHAPGEDRGRYRLVAHIRNSMGNWRRSCAPPSSNSIARSPLAWPKDRQRRCRSWTVPCARAGALQGYHLLPSVRGDLLHKLGRYEEARAEFEAAGRGLAGNQREHEFLRRRAAESAGAAMTP